jgi:glycosyltransferase involved in cell wall biosynthesis
LGVTTALVHDYLLVLRGAERTFAAIADSWPDAPVYTTLYSEKGTDSRFSGHSVTTSYLQRLRPNQGNFRRLLPLFPRATENLPVGGHDIVVSSSSAFAHGVRPGREATHVCFCHSPFRYAWHERDLALAETSPALRSICGRTLDRIREWDRRASERVTHYVAGSELVRERIAEFYGREATVIHPPVETGRFAPAAEHDGYFLFVGELVRHKRVDIALEAARRAERPFKVVGTGPELEALRARYAGSAEFLGRVSDDELAGLYSDAQALVVPNVEEFGIAAVEAQAAGRPVIARNSGGTRETVIHGRTGVLMERGDANELAQVMRDVDFDRFCSDEIARNAARFSRERFQEQFQAEVARAAGG